MYTYIVELVAGPLAIPTTSKSTNGDRLIPLQIGPPEPKRSRSLYGCAHNGRKILGLPKPSC